MSKPDKRDEIVRAALELIAEQGFHGAPMAELAKRAGVGAGTIYRYFENKDLLIEEVFSEIETRITPVLLRGYVADRPVRERFLQLGGALLRYFIGHPVDFRYLEQFFNSPYGSEHRRAKLSDARDDLDAYGELFADGIEQQLMKELPLAVLQSLTFGPLLAAARDHILGFIELDDTLIEQIVEACWDAVSC